MDEIKKGGTPKPPTKDIPVLDNISTEYANVLKVDHNQEEFYLMFITLAGETATANAKVIVTPGHMKRLIETLKDNVILYEERFGQIQSAPRKEDVGGEPQNKDTGETKEHEKRPKR